MTEPIRGKVAQVLNSREIAINVGSAAGVVKGMYFDVLATPKDIRDPDTDEVLGAIDRKKVRVQVSDVQGKFSVATTYRKKRVNTGGVGYLSYPSGMSDLLKPPNWVTKYETLKTEEKTWEDLDEEESYVNIGDIVVQVIKELDTEQESTSP